MMFDPVMFQRVYVCVVIRLNIYEEIHITDLQDKVKLKVHYDTDAVTVSGLRLIFFLF